MEVVFDLDTEAAQTSAWKPRVYSALAGYVEPGESAEDTVAREIREEAGIEVDSDSS